MIRSVKSQEKMRKNKTSELEWNIDKALYSGLAWELIDAVDRIEQVMVM